MSTRYSSQFLVKPSLWRRALTVMLVTLATFSVANASAPAPTQSAAQYETRFMTEMIDHHGMAVMMATMCVDKALHPELKTLCSSIVDSQSQEIQMMQSWLLDWYDVEYSPDMTQGQQQMMDRMAAMPAMEFEMEFLKMMIRHHWKAVIKASQCIESAFHEELVALCENIVLAQSSEIETMRTWLCNWYGLCNYGPKELIGRS